MARYKRLIWFIIMVLFGLTVGIAFGRMIFAVPYENVTADSLRSDYKTDYVLMVAEIYSLEKNILDSESRLGLISDQSPVRVVQEAILAGQTLGYSPVDLETMGILFQDIQAYEIAGGGTAP